MYKFRLMNWLILRRKCTFLSMRIRNPSSFEIRNIPLLGCALHMSNYKCGIDKIPLMERIIQTNYLYLVLLYPAMSLQVAFSGSTDSRRAVCIQFTVWSIAKGIRSCYFASKEILPLLRYFTLSFRVYSSILYSQPSYTLQFVRLSYRYYTNPLKYQGRPNPCHWISSWANTLFFPQKHIARLVFTLTIREKQDKWTNCEYSFTVDVVKLQDWLLFMHRWLHWEYVFELLNFRLFRILIFLFF